MSLTAGGEKENDREKKKEKKEKLMLLKDKVEFHLSRALNCFWE